MHPHLSQAIAQSNEQDFIRSAKEARLVSECRSRTSRMGRLHRLLTGTRTARQATPQPLPGTRGGAAIAH